MTITKRKIMNGTGVIGGTWVGVTSVRGFIAPILFIWQVQIAQYMCISGFMVPEISTKLHVMIIRVSASSQTDNCKSIGKKHYIGI